MWKTAIGEPEGLIETLGVDDKRVHVPFAGRTAVIQRIVRVAARVAALRTPIQIDEPPVVIAAANQHKNALPFLLFQKLDSVRKLELTRPPWRLAEQKRGIVFQEILLAEFEEVPRP